MILRLLQSDDLILKRRSIGISNFGVQDMEILLASAKVKPAVNQVCSTGLISRE